MLYFGACIYTHIHLYELAVLIINARCNYCEESRVAYQFQRSCILSLTLWHFKLYQDHWRW